MVEFFVFSPKQDNAMYAYRRVRQSILLPATSLNVHRFQKYIHQQTQQYAGSKAVVE